MLGRLPQHDPGAEQAQSVIPVFQLMRAGSCAAIKGGFRADGDGSGEGWSHYSEHGRADRGDFAS